MGIIRYFRDLDIYKMAMTATMRIFEETKVFPVEERYSLTGQIRRSSRSVCANIAEAWHKRRYPKFFASKRSDAEAEASETQVWLEISVRCQYLPRETARELYKEYENTQGIIVTMINQSDKWKI